MTTSLTPDLAIGYLRQLTVGLRAAIVLDADGRTLAGDPALEDPARELLAAAGDDAIEVVTPDGAVLAARSQRHAAVVATEPRTVPELLVHDLRRVLADLEAAR